MKKLALLLEAFAVESFATAEESHGGRGTVDGHSVYGPVDPNGGGGGGGGAGGPTGTSYRITFDAACRPYTAVQKPASQVDVVGTFEVFELADPQ